MHADPIRPDEEKMTDSTLQRQSEGLRLWLVGAILCLVLVPPTIIFIDRPLAIWAHQFHGTRVLARVSHLPEWLIPLGILLLAIIAIIIAFGHRSLVADFALRCGVALIVGATIKDQLKILFGRTWPEGWLQNNPSFINDGVYGFWPAHGGTAYGAFPSGHTTAGLIVLTLLWQYWPRLRALYVAAGAGLITLLVAGGFHWLSDTIAGAFLGVAIGWVAAALGRPQALLPASATESPVPDAI